MFTQDCRYCHKAFTTRERRIRFCSKRCGGLNRGTGKNVNCHVCGTLFYRNGFRIRHSDLHFCSHACFYSYQTKRITRICKKCGKAYETVPSRLKTFCSVYCQKRVGQTSVTKAGYLQRTVPGGRIYEHRRIVEEFLGRKLEGAEIVHHINMNKQDNRLENLLVVTNKQHMKLHGEMERLVGELLVKGVVEFTGGHYRMKKAA